MNFAMREESNKMISVTQIGSEPQPQERSEKRRKKPIFSLKKRSIGMLKVTAAAKLQ